MPGSEIELPAVPAGVLTLLGFFLPYAQALLQRPSWSAAAKRIVAIVLPIVLTAVVLLFYFVMTGDPLPSWPVLAILTLTVSQASYAMVTHRSAKELEIRTSPE